MINPTKEEINEIVSLNVEMDFSKQHLTNQKPLI